MYGVALVVYTRPSPPPFTPLIDTRLIVVVNSLRVLSELLNFIVLSCYSEPTEKTNVFMGDFAVRDFVTMTMR